MSTFVTAGNHFLSRTKSELKLRIPLHPKIHNKAPPLAKVYRLSQSEPHLKAASQFETPDPTPHHAAKHMARTNDASVQCLCEPAAQTEMPKITASKATQTEGPAVGIDTSLLMDGHDKTGVHDSHATQTELVQTTETAVQVDMVVTATTPPTPVGFSAAATQTSADRIELKASSEFPQLVADLVGWVARQEVHQMSEAARDVFACNLKELKERIEQAENCLVWLSIVSKLSSVDCDMEQ